MQNKNQKLKIATSLGSYKIKKIACTLSVNFFQTIKKYSKMLNLSPYLEIKCICGYLTLNISSSFCKHSIGQSFSFARACLFRRALAA